MRDQDVSEGLDADKLTGEYPPDDPAASDDYGVTARQDAIEEPVGERVAKREVPDDPAAGQVTEEGEVGQLVESDEGARVDLEDQAVADEGVSTVPGEQRETGDIASGDTTLRDTATERVPEAAAEEAAVHETEPPPLGDDVPPGGPGDGYIEED